MGAGELSAEDARRLIPLILARRAAEAVGGALVQAAGEDAIALFCGHCDYRDNAQACPPSDQGRYVFRNQCGWSARARNRLDSVSATSLKFNGVEYPRTELERVDAAMSSRQ